MKIPIFRIFTGSFSFPLPAFLLFLPLVPSTARGNTTPVAVDDVLLATAGSNLSFNYLLLNDSDAEADALSVSATTMPAVGSLVDHGGNAFTFTPASVGDDSFDYTASDGTDTATATVRISVNAAYATEAARDDILSDVTSIADPSGPGHMVAWGPTAQVISSYPGQDERDPMIVAATMAAGRIIALPDHQWLNMDTHGVDASTGNFYRNGISWLTGTTSKTTIKVVTFNASSSTWLGNDGYTDVVNANSASLATELATANVLVTWPGNNPSQAVIDAIIQFTKNGGGLFICDYGIGYDWWWGKATPDIPGNRILRDAGVAFTKQYPHGSGVQVINRATDQVTDDDVLAIIANPAAYTATEKDRAGEIFNRLNDAVADGDTLQSRLDVEFWARIGSLYPTPATPISDSLDRALLNREAEILRDLPASQVTAHRTAEDVYGVIPPGAPRVTETVTLNATRSRWHATGLYAVPGELVTVTVPPPMVGQGYKIRINAHTDWVSRTTLERLPYVHRSYPIDAATTQVACAFGGAIFIDFGGDAWSGAPSLGNVDIDISNAIEHPYFDLNQHTDTDWLNGLRDKPAPYAVFVSDNMMFCQRSSESTALTTPTALMTWWHKVITDQDWVGGRVTTRVGGELTNVDVQNSAGAAHSGYPVQAYDKYWGNLADYPSLALSGSWGDFHELGHNHQRGWWNFGPDGEVTVNIFSNHNKEIMASEPTTGGWGWSADPIQVIDTATSDVAPGGSYVSKANRWSFWFQLADGFGWGTYHDVLESYELDNLNNPSALPSTNIEKQDQFYTRWSIACGSDMADFMIDTWGLEVTQTARDAVAALSLPDWMPVVGSITTATVLPGTPLVLDLEGGAHSMDGVANLTAVTPPAHGGWVDHGDGTVTYTPDPGFIGDDTFTYTLQSSSGNTVETVLAITVAPINESLLAHWNLDEGSGTTTADSSGNGLDGTLQGTAALASGNGIKGGSLGLDGSGQVSTPALGVTTNSLTITGWIKRSGAQNSSAGLYFTRGGSAGATGFNMYDSTTLGYHWTGSSSTWSWNSGLVVPENQWTFVALVVEPDQVTIYMDDGTGIQSNTKTNTHPALTFDAVHHLGYDPNSPSRRFKGLMDDWRVYDGALSAQSVAGVHLSGLNQPPVIDISISDVKVTEDAADTDLDLSQSFSDPDPSDVLGYSITGNSNPSLVTTTIAGSGLTLGYTTGQSGSASITVRATDPGGAFIENTFTVTVEPDNDGDGLSDAIDPDDDNDTIPDTWENANGLDPFIDDASGDADGDGADNRTEYAFDTGASNSGSRPATEIEREVSDDSINLRFDTSAARSYLIEYRPDLTAGTWQELLPMFAGDGNEKVVNDATTEPIRFYRVGAIIP